MISKPLKTAIKVVAAVLGTVGTAYGAAMYAAGSSGAHETRQDERIGEHDAGFLKVNERLDGKDGKGGIRGQLEEIDRKVDKLGVVLEERLPKKSGMGD